MGHHHEFIKLSYKQLQALRLAVGVASVLAVCLAVNSEKISFLPNWSAYIFWLFFLLCAVLTSILRRESEQRPKKQKDDNQFFIQLAFTIFCFLAFVVTTYGALVTSDTHSRIVRIIGASIFLVLAILLAWGLVYIKRAEKQAKLDKSEGV
ncbi:hypothetical protein [Streptococcus sobrinus]|uniref:hypothetical protein n=1 Tax=Streptococcus sobrinus TaxID=1310 RepID=UPI000D705D9E|nr:hypothetical protein [Streptococcus sobrinus]AWN61708.1 hypothetical protein DLJ52_05655 [Streptococcus sobrinus]AWN63579.1 hypothetical protein DLJ51_05655 [Streptococcus sobrinus]SQG20178.1 Predicted membrane protein [Streptococcus sobrinus]